MTYKTDDEQSLASAAQENDLKVAKELLDKGINVDCVNEDRVTPLALAVCKNHLEMVKLLVEHGADPWYESGSKYWNYSPRTWSDSSSKGNRSIYKFFIQKGYTRGNEETFFSEIFNRLDSIEAQLTKLTKAEN